MAAATPSIPQLFREGGLDMRDCAHFQWSGSLLQEQPCSVANVALFFYAVKCILIYLSCSRLELKNFPDSWFHPDLHSQGFIYYVINNCLPPCFPGGLVVKNPPFNAEAGYNPRWENPWEEGNGMAPYSSPRRIPQLRRAWSYCLIRL